YDAFVASVRPGRRAVRVTMRADLVADTEQLVIQFDDLDDADKDGEQAEQILAEYQALKAQILDSRRTFVVEGRSDHRRRQIAKQWENRASRSPARKPMTKNMLTITVSLLSTVWRTLSLSLPMCLLTAYGNSMRSLALR